MRINTVIQGKVIGLIGRLCAVFVAASVLFPLGNYSSALAQGAGNLIVAPTRIVLEGRDRSAQLVLSNTGSASATYRISIVNLRMKEDGGVTEITEPDEGQNFAGKLIRYSPRQITLAPGGTQTVRVLLRKSKNLADGEYRSHIFFRGIPDDGGQSVNAASADGDLQIRLIPVYGITLPIIVRHGKIDAQVSLNGLNIVAPSEEQPLPTLNFQILRAGNASAFGDLVATHVAASGEKTVIGQIRRLAVYTPNTGRTVNMTLRVADGVSLSNGQIDLVYQQIEDDGGKLIGESNLKLR